MAEVMLQIVEKRADLLPALIKSIQISNATQILVTGLGAYNMFSNNKNEIATSLGSEWTIWGPPYDPTSQDINHLLERFAKAIYDEPEKRHICFGPTEDYQVRQHLFKVVPSFPYRASIYVLDLVADPISYLTGLSTSINREDRASGDLYCIFSTVDSLVPDSVREKMKNAPSFSPEANRIAWEHMQYLEEIYPYRDALAAKAREESIKNLSKAIEKKFSGKKWWEFWK